MSVRSEAASHNDAMTQPSSLLHCYLLHCCCCYHITIYHNTANKDVSSVCAFVSGKLAPFFLPKLKSFNFLLQVLEGVLHILFWSTWRNKEWGVFDLLTGRARTGKIIKNRMQFQLTKLIARLAQR